MENLAKYVTEIISEFHWSKGAIISEALPEIIVVVDFPKCRLKIIYEEDSWGDVRVEFSKPITDPNKFKNSYNIYDIIECIIPSYRINRKFPDELFSVSTKGILNDDLKVKIIIKNMFVIIDNYLVSVINGDFSWMEKQDLFEINRKKIADKLKTVSIFEHPIYIKLIKDDPTWKDDLDKL